VEAASFFARKHISVPEVPGRAAFDGSGRGFSSWPIGGMVPDKLDGRAISKALEEAALEWFYLRNEERKLSKTIEYKSYFEKAGNR
jgi:hypothetical protein